MSSIGATSLPRLMLGTLTSASLFACGPQPLPGPETGKAKTAIAESAVDPAVYRGSATALQVCAQCHDVGAGSAPTSKTVAPSFVAVANRPDTTSNSVVQWLGSSHPSMPNFIFDGPLMSDLAAYIMSLRKGS